MAQIIDVPNYGQVEFPDDMSDADIVAAIKKTSMGYKPEKQEFGSMRNLGLGLAKGVSGIGTTLLTPVDMAIGKTDRRQQLNDFFNENANTDSLAFKGGELGAQIAGTAGAGGAVAKALSAIPAVARTVPALIKAIESGGFTLGKPAATTIAGKFGNTALRAAGGAIGGGASAAMVDPSTAGTGALIGGAIPGAAQAAGMVGKGVKNLAGFTAKTSIGSATGAGSEALSQAFQSGRTGNQAFLENMRGKVPMTDVLDQAKEALTQMRLDRAAQYRSGMADISKDKTVLDFAPIDKALNNLKSMGSYKGQVINKNASGTVQEIADKVQEWAALDPKEFHTPEGLDALKQAIGDIRDATQFGTTARKSADEVYNAIKNQITMQAPSYAKVMKDYSEASETLSEVTRALSLGNKTAADTGIRKLQSLMRNNAQSNYGNRLDLAKTLQTEGGQDVLPAVAGQALNSWTPRGMVGALEKAGIPLAAFAQPGLLAAAPLTSPRLMGEAAYGLGATTRKVSEMAGPLNQSMIAQQMRALASNPAYASLLTVAPSLALSQ